MNEDTPMMIDILDLTAVEAHVLQTFKEQTSSDPASSAFDVEHDQVIGFRVTRRVGRHVTPTDQVYVVIEGIGAVGPITASDPLHIGVRRRYEPGMHPNPHRVVDDHFATLFPSDLIGAPAIDQLPIDQLIPGSMRTREAWLMLRNAS